MELLDERPVWSMSSSEKLTALDLLDADLARRETYRLQLIASLDQDGYAEQLGAHDTAQLLAFRHRLDLPKARRDVRLARALPKYPTVSAALAQPTAPEDNASIDDPATPPDNADAPADPTADAQPAVFLRPAQAEAIITALERVPNTVPVENINVAERELVLLARHLSPSELRRAGQRARDLLDTDGPEPNEHKAYARESLTLSTADNGVQFRGYLANENAELLRTLIHAGARPHKTLDGEYDPRPRDKRQADALTSILTTAAATTDAGPTPPAGTTQADATVDPKTAQVPGFGAKANITVTIDFNDLKAATTDAIGTLVYGDALSAATIRRLACDAKIIPLVLGSNSEPLDVGRAERLVTRPIRRALNARDKGCVVCGAPPIQCDAHHLTSWIDGGTTAIHNLALLCRRHHADLHHGHWTITITNGAVHVTRPTWADPPPPRPTPRPKPQTTTPSPTPEANAARPTTQATTTRPNGQATITRPTGQTDTAQPTHPPTPPSPCTESAPSNPSPLRRSTTPPPATPAIPPAHNSSRPTTPDATPPPASVSTSPTRSTSTPTTTDATPQSDSVAASPPRDSSTPTPTAPRPGLLHRRLLAEHPAANTPSALREAASLAIWGEPPTPTTEHVALDITPFLGDHPHDHHDRFPDPWQDPVTTSGPAP